MNRPTVSYTPEYTWKCTHLMVISNLFCVLIFTPTWVVLSKLGDAKSLYEFFFLDITKPEFEIVHMGMFLIVGSILEIIMALVLQRAIERKKKGVLLAWVFYAVVYQVTLISLALITNSVFIFCHFIITGIPTCVVIPPVVFLSIQYHNERQHVVSLAESKVEIETQTESEDCPPSYNSIYPSRQLTVPLLEV